MNAHDKVIKGTQDAIKASTDKVLTAGCLLKHHVTHFVEKEVDGKIELVEEEIGSHHVLTLVFNSGESEIKLEIW